MSTTASSGVSGASPINVPQLVANMMTLEKQPQTILKNQQSSYNDLVAAYQTLATTMSGVQTAAQAIVGPGGSTPWVLNTATSSSTNVSATASSSAIAGTYSFNVTNVAAAHSALYSGQMALTAQASTGTSFVLTQGGVTSNITTTDTSLAGVISAINSTPGLNVKAAAVQTGTGVYQLQLNATSAGAASQFTLSGLTAAVGTATVLTTGADAAIQIGANTVTSLRSRRWRTPTASRLATTWLA
jgi:flagellar hook-associated protein 2